MPDRAAFAIVDAFTTDRPFSGNPAGVLLLDEFPEPAWMQGVANELQQAETAFLAPGGEDGAFQLRWFTPVAEVALCGHATLASPHCLSESQSPRRRSIAGVTSWCKTSHVACGLAKSSVSPPGPGSASGSYGTTCEATRPRWGPVGQVANGAGCGTRNRRHSRQAMTNSPPAGAGLCWTTPAVARPLSTR